MERTSDDEEEQLRDVTLELNALNNTLSERTPHDVSSHHVNISSLFLKELLLKQEESHRKIQELQKTIQTKALTKSNLPSLSHSLRSTNTSLHEDQFGDSESNVSLEPYMVEEDESREHNIPFINEGHSINEGQHNNYEKKRNHSIDSITTLGSYKELNLTRVHNTLENQEQLNEQKKKHTFHFEIPMDEKCKHNNKNNESYDRVKNSTLVLNKKEVGAGFEEEDVNDKENSIFDINLQQEKFSSSESSESIATTIEQRRESNNDYKHSQLSKKIFVEDSRENSYSKFEGGTETRKNFKVANSHDLGHPKDNNRRNSPLKSKFTEQKLQNSDTKTAPEDELTLCIDIMAACMKEVELEKERVKLDVIVALKKRFNDLLYNNSQSQSKEVPTQFFEELNENLYDITFDEVTRIKKEECEKQQRIEEGYQLQVQKLSKELEKVAQERCEFLLEIANYKQKTHVLEESQSKIERSENRTAYLESLLQNIENENTKLKRKFEKIETENLGLKLQNRTFSSSVSDLNHKLELSASAEESTKQHFNMEHQMLLDENKRTKDELFELYNKIECLKQEKQRVVNSKETDMSIIKHLEEKLKRQGTLLENVSADSNKYFEINLKLENKATEYQQKLKKCAFSIEAAQQQNKKLQEDNMALEREKSELKKTIGEWKQRESECSFQLTKLKSDFERQQSSWNSQRERLERKLKSQLAEFHTIYNKKLNSSRIETQKFSDQSLFEPNGFNIKTNISRSDPIKTLSFSQSLLNDSDTIQHNHSYISRNDETLKTILQPNTYGSLGEIVTSSTKNKLDVQPAIPQNSYLELSKFNHTRNNINGQSALSSFKYTSNLSHSVATINNNNILSTTNTSNGKSSPMEDTHFYAGKSPPYSSTSLPRPFANSSIILPTTEAAIYDTINDGVSYFENNGFANGKHASKSKYTANDTKLFLKEMSYKLQHTEAALKLADPDTSSNFTFASTSLDALQNRINGLRDEVMLSG